MQIHDISINNKYFEPIRDGQITLLIFKQKTIHNETPGDFLLASRGSYDVKAKIIKTYLKTFKDITDKEARKAGFLNKDFLKDELIQQYDLKPYFNFETGSNIDNEIFFLIEITNKKEPEFKIKDEHIKVNLYSNQYNKEFYNEEYDTKPWEDIT